MFRRKKNSEPTKKLYGLLLKHKWDEASRRCRRHPEDARWKEGDRGLPIHWACWYYGAPLSLIRQLHEAYGDGVRVTNDFGSLPLHEACHHAASLEVIRYVHGRYPDGVTKKDNRGWTPADYLRSNKRLSHQNKAAAMAILSRPPDPRTTSAKVGDVRLGAEAAAADGGSKRKYSKAVDTRAKKIDVVRLAAETSPADCASKRADAVVEEAAAAERGATTSPPADVGFFAAEGEGISERRTKGAEVGTIPRKGEEVASRGDIVGHDDATPLTAQQHLAIQALTRNLHDFDKSLEAVRGPPTSLSGSPEHVRRYFRSFVSAFERTYVAAQALSTGAIQGQLMDRDMLVFALENLGAGAEACGVPFAGAISIFTSLAMYQMQTRQDNMLGVFQEFFAGDSHMSHVLVCRSTAEQICLRSDLSDFSGRDAPRVRKLRTKVQCAIRRLEEKLQNCHLLPVEDLEPIEVKVMDDLSTVTEAVMTMWLKRRHTYVTLKHANDEFRVQWTLDALSLGEVCLATCRPTTDAEKTHGSPTSSSDLPKKKVDAPVRGNDVAQAAPPPTYNQRLPSPSDKVVELETEILRLKKQMAKLTPTDDDETVDVGSRHNQSQAMCFVSKHSRERKRAGETGAHEYNRLVGATDGDIQDVREIVHTLSLDNFMTRRVLSVIEARKFIEQVLMCSKGDRTGGSPEGLHHHKSVSFDEKGRFLLNGKSYRIGYMEGQVGPSKKLWDGKSEIRFDLDTKGARSVKYWFIENGLEHRYNAHGKAVIRHMFAKEFPN